MSHLITSDVQKAGLTLNMDKTERWWSTSPPLDKDMRLGLPLHIDHTENLLWAGLQGYN